MTHYEFIERAVKTLRKGDYKGIHTVYSGFNAAFRKVFPGDNPVEVTRNLEQEGKIVVKLARGGAMIYLPEDAPAKKDSADEVLKKMGLA